MLLEVVVRRQATTTVKPLYSEHHRDLESVCNKEVSAKQRFDLFLKRNDIKILKRIRYLNETLSGK